MYKFLVWAVLLAASFASNDARAEFRTLEGTAVYRERIALRPGAILEVELRDVSRSDARAAILASIAVRPTGQVPIRFRLLYDSALIDERMTYAVSAKLKFGNRVLFRSTSVHPVLTRGSPDRVEIEMVRMPMAKNSKNTRTSLFGATWLAEDIRGRGVIDNAQTTIAFQPDGAVAGSGGCNRFHGKAEIDGPHLKFGPLAATRKACIPALSDQEQKFFAVLSEVRQFQIKEPEGKLILKSGAGETLATLSKLKRAP